MTRLDRDLRLLALAMLLYAFGYGMYYQLLGVYALELGASRFAVGALNAVMLAFWAASILPGAWAACRFSLRAVIVGVWWITVPAGVSFLLAPSWEWLVPGFVLSGCYMANNPAMKVYVQRKADPQRLTSTMSLVFGASSLGFILSPMIGGFLADRIGMRWVFALSTGIFLLSSLAATMTRHEPYRPETGAPRLSELAGNQSLRRYLVFFLLGFLGVYLGQPFLSPYLAQVHGQSYAALGVFAALASTGATLLNVGAGRLTDRHGPRAGVALLLLLAVTGIVLLMAGNSRTVWGIAMLCCGAFETFRYVAAGVCSRSFNRLPLV